MAVMGVAMLGTGWVSSRVGAKRTLLARPALIIVGAGLAGSQDTVGGIVAFRAVWGLGNALFIATALATIVSAASGSVKQAIILYEAALGVGIATGPLLGGWLGGHLVALAVLRRRRPHGDRLHRDLDDPAGDAAAEHAGTASPRRCARCRHRGLLTVGITALLYNFGFFTLLAFTPFPLAMGAHEIGSRLLRLGRAARLHLGLRRPEDPAPLRHPGRHRRRAARLRGDPRRHGDLDRAQARPRRRRHPRRCVPRREQHPHHRDGHEGRPGRARGRLRGLQLRPLQRRRRRAMARRQPRRASIHMPFWVGSGRRRARRPRPAHGAPHHQALDEAPGHGAEAVTSRVEAEALTVGDAERTRPVCTANAASLGGRGVRASGPVRSGQRADARLASPDSTRLVSLLPNSTPRRSFPRKVRTITTTKTGTIVTASAKG